MKKIIVAITLALSLFAVPVTANAGIFEKGQWDTDAETIENGSSSNSNSSSQSSSSSYSSNSSYSSDSSSQSTDDSEDTKEKEEEEKEEKKEEEEEEEDEVTISAPVVITPTADEVETSEIVTTTADEVETKDASSDASGDTVITREDYNLQKQSKSMIPAILSLVCFAGSGLTIIIRKE